MGVAGHPTGTAPGRGETLSLGALLGRPDLDDAVIREAIVERLSMDGRRGIDPDVVMEAARLRKRKAVAFLRQLVLPPPRGRLEMPVRPILRSQIARMS